MKMLSLSIFCWKLAYVLRLVHITLYVHIIIYATFILLLFIQDALLHAIKEEYVEAVEIMLEYEETHHKVGDPYVSSYQTILLDSKNLLIR